MHNTWINVSNRMAMIYTLAVVGFIIFIGASIWLDTNSGQKRVSTTAVFHGLSVPPDPGAAANVTVAGVDTDNNGIRDEIDRYIAQTYGDNPTKYKAAQSAAKANQKVLTVSITDIKAATAAVFANADNGVCVVDMMGSDYIGASKLLDDIILQTYNTTKRIAQGQKIRALVGQFTRSTTGVTCP